MTLPELHMDEWRATKDTLHLYCQILGKIRLATTAPRNHWWNAPLYVDVRGLTTRRLHHRATTFEITIDFIDHMSWLFARQMVARGRSRSPAESRSRTSITASMGCSASLASTSRSGSTRSASP